MNELEEDLRSVAESIAAEAERLKELEDFKATLASDDPRVLALSEQSERMTRQMVALASSEKELALEASGS